MNEAERRQAPHRRVASLLLPSLLEHLLKKIYFRRKIELKIELTAVASRAPGGQVRYYYYYIMVLLYQLMIMIYEHLLGPEVSVGFRLQVASKIGKAQAISQR